jgi:hypothetical protein
VRKIRPLSDVRGYDVYVVQRCMATTRAVPMTSFVG